MTMRERGFRTFLGMLIAFSVLAIQVRMVVAEEPAADHVPAEEVTAAEQPAEQVPAAEQPADQVPAEEAPAAEPIVDQSADEQPAADQPAADQPAEQSAADEPVPAGSSAGAGSAPSDPASGAGFSASSRLGPRALESAPTLGSSDFSFDFEGYDPPGGTHSGWRESLEAEDFDCGEQVTFRTVVKLKSSAPAGNYALTVAHSFAQRSTSDAGVGYRDFVGATVDGAAAPKTHSFPAATSVPGSVSVTIASIQPGQTKTIEIIVLLGCDAVVDRLTGNVHASVTGATVASPALDFNVGSQTVTLKLSDVENAITIVKTTEPTQAEDVLFSFTSDELGAFTLDTDPGTSSKKSSKTFDKLGIDTYTVTEGATSGWELDSIECGDEIVTTDGSSVSIALGFGQTTTCTFHNVPQEPPATLTVVKDVVNDDGGEAAATAFTMTVTPDEGDPQSFPGDPDGTELSLTPGSYTVSEDGPAGYAGAFSGDCAEDGTITLRSGDAATCTVTNDDIAPTLSVTKTVVPDDDDGEFQLEIDDQVYATGGNGASTGDVAIDAGDHTVGERGGDAFDLEDYAAVIGGDCAEDGSIHLDLGEHASCTITNTRLASITIAKETDPAESEQSFDFTFGPEGGEEREAFSLTGGEARDFDRLEPGRYVAGELGLEDWSLESIDCGDANATTQGAEVAIDLAAGADVTCTFTNVMEPPTAPTLTVVKRVTNDDGGDAQPSDFTISVDGPGEGDADSFAGSADGVLLDLDPGEWSVSESGGPPGYVATFSGDCSEDGTVSLEYGDTAICTITNDDVGPTLRVDKVVLPEGDAGTFDLHIDGEPAGLGVGVGDGGSTGAVEVLAGEHTVGEAAGDEATNLEEYLSLIGGDCAADGSITLALGEDATCTIFNVRLARVVVTKEAGDDAGNASFEFSLTGGPFEPEAEEFAQTVDEPFSLGDGGSHDTGYTLPPGVYGVSEAEKAGWRLDGVDCGQSSPEEFLLGPGETVSCTFTNTNIPASIALDKSVDRAVIHAGDTVTYSYVVQNLGADVLHAVLLSDDKCFPITGPSGDLGGDGVLSPPAEGTPGETWTYTCTTALTADTTNTALVSALDSNDDPVGPETDSQFVDVINPGIGVDKNSDVAFGSPGDAVTFTFTVTNTGDTDLFNVAVDDDVLGAIGTIPTLPAGASVDLTATTRLGDAPLVNTVTVDGADRLGNHVRAQDTHTVAVVLGEVTTRPGPGSVDEVLGEMLAFTGRNLIWLLLGAGLAMLVGLALRRRSSRREHA